MRIVDTLLAPGQGAYYCEDIAALQARSIPESERWAAPGVTPGFRKVREIAETLGVGLVLEDGYVAWGDCVGVSYGGKSGREPVLRAIEAKALVPVADLKGRSAESFREWTGWLQRQELPTALRYGISQALLGAVAHTRREIPAAVLCREWNLERSWKPVPLQGSSGNDRIANAEKMVHQRLDALPHTQVDDAATQFGANGEVLLNYARWVVDLVRSEPDYQPILHFDVHGAIGRAFPDTAARVAYLGQLQKICKGYDCRIESPIIAETRADQIENFAALRAGLRRSGVEVSLVADEWVGSVNDIRAFIVADAIDMAHIKMPNFGGLERSIEAVLACRAFGIQSLLGGSCIETDLSTRLSVQVALATQPDMFLVKPGMGINEGIAIVRNEMARAIAQGCAQGESNAVG